MASEGCSTVSDKDRMEATVSAVNIIAQGKRNLVCGEVPTAVNQFQEACKILSKAYGETAKECAEAYFCYGQALLDLARVETGVLGNALQGVPDTDEEENSEEKSSTDEQFEKDTVEGEEREKLRKEVYDAMSEDERKALAGGDKNKDNKAQKEASSGETVEVAMDTDDKAEVKDNKEKEKEEGKESEKVDEKKEAGKQKEEGKEGSEKVEEKKEAEKDKEEKVDEKKEAVKDQEEKAEKEKEKVEEKMETEKSEEKATEKKEEKKDAIAEKSKDEKAASDDKVEKEDKEKQEDKADKTEDKKEEKDGKSEEDKQDVEMEEDGKQKEGEGKEASTEEEGEGEEGEGEGAEGEEGEDAEEEGDDVSQESQDEEKKEGEEDPDDVSNLQLAWEMLELAKLIYLKDEAKEAKLRAAEAHLKLGEVSLETEQYEQSIEDFKACLNIQKEYLDPEDRLMAETYYQLGLAYGFNKQYDEAIETYRTAVKTIESKIGKLKTFIETKKTEKEKGEEKKAESEGFDDPVSSAEQEIKDLEGILPDIKAKIEDTEEEKKNFEQLKAMAKEAVGTGGFGDSSSSTETAMTTAQQTAQSTDKPATDISHLIKRKRKPEDEETDEKGAEVKKTRQEEGAGDAATVQQNGFDKTPEKDKEVKDVPMEEAKPAETAAS